MCYLIYVISDSVYLTKQSYIFIGRTGANFFPHNQLADKSTYINPGKCSLFYKVLFFRI